MFWLLMALLVIVASLMMLRRKADLRTAEEEEPWRRSLDDADEPLDIEEIREAESEWLESSGWDEPEDEGWR